MKAVVIAVQGVSMQDNGGMWNGGMLGGSLRLAQVEDEAFVVDAMDRVNTELSDWYNSEFSGRTYEDASGNTQAASNVTNALDRTKLHFIGYSQGAQFAYRMAAQLPSHTTTWELEALAVFAGSSGGWRQFDSYDTTPRPAADVDWTPSSLDFSVLHIHGEDDLALPSSDTVQIAAPSQNDIDRCLDETGWEYMVDSQADFVLEAYFTGKHSAAKCAALAGGTWAVNNNPSGLTAMTASTTSATELGEWDTAGGANWDRAVYFYEIASPQGHDWIAGSLLPNCFVEFFQTWGAL